LFDLIREGVNQSLGSPQPECQRYANGTAGNARACPNFEQYYGKVVNGVDPNIVIGAFRFPQNVAIAAVEAAAKEASSSGAFSLDAILFGKWTD
jgi:hypothetical protein